MAGEVFDLVESSNILVMKCYKYIFNDFSNSVGGIISIVSLTGSLACTLIYFLFGKKQIKCYIYNIYEKFMNFVEKIGLTGCEAPPKRGIKNMNLKEMLIKNKNQKIVRFKEEPKEIKKKIKEMILQILILVLL